MSKGSSNLAIKTKGAKEIQKAMVEIAKAARLKEGTKFSVQKKKAFEKAKDIAKNGTRKERDKLNTVTIVYDETTGKSYYGMNHGIELHGTPKNATLFGDETHAGLLPKESLCDYKVGNCAEIDAVNKALNDGAKLENLHMTTIHATKRAIKENKIIPKPACKNCRHALKGKIKRNNTGWEGE